jgi:hypothetical protein
MKTNLIIFSKNRACQLELLLSSIERFAPHLFDDITVLYKAMDEYLVAYMQLIKMKPNIKFVKETDFRSDVLNLINTPYDFTSFLVDDAVFYKAVDSSKEEICNQITNDVVCFSLRLGKNCNYSHPANLHYTLGEHKSFANMIKFEFNRQEAGDFKYPLSVDGHIFNTPFITMLISKINFNNPNTLEASLQSYMVTNFLPKNLVSFNESKLVSIPVNLVNTTFKNRHGLEFFMSEEELNDKFICGYTIDFDVMNFNNINGPHKEIKYEFKKS